jgi:hypothetical protein
MMATPKRRTPLSAPRYARGRSRTRADTRRSMPQRVRLAAIYDIALREERDRT